jgi:CRISPR-associated endonuclease/helicase Cas3
VDFETVYREQAGLDSIVQAAGRCNREGKRNRDESIVYVFTAAEHKPPRMIQPNIDAYNHISRKYEDLAHPDTIQAYFQQLFYNIGNEQLDTKEILRLFNEGAKNNMAFPFEDVANVFNLINDSSQRALYVLHEAPELEKRVRAGERNRGLFRKLNQYSISLFNQDIKELDAIGAIDRLGGDESVWLLLEHHYDEQIGVSLSPQGGQAIIV